MSSNLAIGTATSFVLVAATLGVALDHRQAMPLAPGASDLGLRGTIPPADVPLFTPRFKATTPKTSPLA